MTDSDCARCGHSANLHEAAGCRGWRFDSTVCSCNEFTTTAPKTDVQRLRDAGYELGDLEVYRENHVAPRVAAGTVERVDPVRGVGVHFEPTTPTTPTAAAFERGASEGALEVAATRWLRTVTLDEDANLALALDRWLRARGVEVLGTWRLPDRGGQGDG